MALSNSTIITRARMLLQDVVVGAYRWTDAELTYWIQDGAQDIARKRPEAVVSYQSNPTSVAIPTEASGIVELYSTALLNYICYRALAKDGEDGESSMANHYLQSFELAMGKRSK